MVKDQHTGNRLVNRKTEVTKVDFLLFISMEDKGSNNPVLFYYIRLVEFIKNRVPFTLETPRG